uniref:zinc finger protein 184-like n=1 Tax=Myxine glutinosa TaxID=7769 RepID=UPI00358DFECF
MNRDLSGEDHRSNPPGSTSGSDGGNSVVPGDSPSDRGSRVGPPDDMQSLPDFIVRVKMKSKFIDDSFPQDEGFIVEVKVKSEYVESSFQHKDADGNLMVDPALVQRPLRGNQMKMVSCSKSSSHFFDSEVSFNQNMTQTSCQEVNKYSRVLTKNKNWITTFKKTKRNEKPHMCSVCKKTFSSLKSLKICQRLHKRERRHKCNVCSKEFPHLSSMKCHQVKHRREAFSMSCVQQDFCFFIVFQSTSKNTPQSE